MATLLEVVRRAAAAEEEGFAPSECSITLNAESVIGTLLSTNSAEKETETETEREAMLRRLSLWEMDGKDKQIIEAETELLKHLKCQDLTPKSFLQLLQPFLLKVQAGVSTSGKIKNKKQNPTLLLLQNVAPYLGRAIVKEIMKYSVALKYWEPLRILLAKGNVSFSWNIVQQLAEARRGDMLCIFLENVREVRPRDLLLILRYFLRPTRYDKTMSVMRRERKKQTLAAIETAIRKKTRDIKREFILQQTAVLLAAAFDGFSPSEFCLHCLVSSSIDENVLGSVVSRLDTEDVLKLLKYLAKWLGTYSGCHLTGPLEILSVNVFSSRWVPSLASVMQWVGVILDEGFSTLILCADFHEELKSVEGMVRALVETASGVSSLASIVELLRSDAKLPNINRFKTNEDHVVEYLDWGSLLSV